MSACESIDATKKPKTRPKEGSICLSICLKTRMSQLSQRPLGRSVNLFFALLETFFESTNGHGMSGGLFERRISPV